MKKKISVGVVFGGRSVEHQVSVVSAKSVMSALDRRKFDVVPIGITPDGRWIGGRDAVRYLESGGREGRPSLIGFLPDPTLRSMAGEGSRARRPDVMFPVLHG